MVLYEAMENQKEWGEAPAEMLALMPVDGLETAGGTDDGVNPMPFLIFGDDEEEDEGVDGEEDFEEDEDDFEDEDFEDDEFDDDDDDDDDDFEDDDDDFEDDDYDDDEFEE